MADEAKRLDKGSAARLLSDWRAAERDSAAAHESAAVAKLAVSAAQAAERAAIETAESAKLALDAATRAERSARETADAARLLSVQTGKDAAAAEREVARSEKAEETARARFHDAQDAGFPAASRPDPTTGE